MKHQKSSNSANFHKKIRSAPCLLIPENIDEGPERNIRPHLLRRAFSKLESSTCNNERQREELRWAREQDITRLYSGAWTAYIEGQSENSAVSDESYPSKEASTDESSTREYCSLSDSDGVRFGDDLFKDEQCRTLSPQEPEFQPAEGCEQEDLSDPFGILEIEPEIEAADQTVARALRRAATKRWKRVGRNFWRGVGHVQNSSKEFLSRSPYTIGWTRQGEKCPTDTEDEELGSRKAIGMVNSWNRPELLMTYVLLIVLVNQLHLWDTIGPMVMRRELSRCSPDCDLGPWKDQMPSALMDTLFVMSFVIFAKISNAHSRPSGIFLAGLFYCCGIGTLAIRPTAISATIGISCLEFGRGGMMLVSEVLVADCTSPKTRAIYTWGLHCSVAVWMWLAVLFDTAIEASTEIERQRTTWILLGSAGSIIVPLCIAIYVFVRRAGRHGYYLESSYLYSWNIFNIKKLFGSLRNIVAKYDMFGITFWNLASFLFLLPMAIPPKMSIGFGRQWLLAGGVASALFFGVWELHVTGLLFRRRKDAVPVTSRFQTVAEQPIQPNSSQEGIELDTIGSGTGRFQIFDETMSSASLPSVLNVVDHSWVGLGTVESLNVDSRRRTTTWPEQSHWRLHPAQPKFRNICAPLLSKALLYSRKLPVACLIVGCSSFALSAALWTLQWNTSTLRYPDSKEEATWIYWISGLAPTCSTLAGLIASVVLVRYKTVKVIVQLGLFMECTVGVIMFGAYLGGSTSPTMYYIPSILLGGSGFVDIPVLISAQAFCSSQTDVTMTIAMLFTAREFSNVAGRAFCQTVLGFHIRNDPMSYLDMAPPGSVHAMNVRGVVAGAVLLATTTGIVTSSLYLSNNLPAHRKPTGTILQVHGLKLATLSVPREQTNESEDQFPGGPPYTDHTCTTPALPAPTLAYPRFP